MCIRLDAIFAQHDIVLPSTEMAMSECFKEAAKTIAARIFDGAKMPQLDAFEPDLSECSVFHLKSGKNPSDALEAASQNCCEQVMKSSLIGHLALKQFLFSREEGNERFDTIFSSDGTNPLVISDESCGMGSLTPFCNAENQLDNRIVVLAKMLPLSELSVFMERLKKRDTSVLDICRQFSFEDPDRPVPPPSFIKAHAELLPFQHEMNAVMITSPGRSGSTLLTKVIEKVNADFSVLKSHLLPFEADFKGKILFIFSNPDQAAESALHLSIEDDWFGTHHFIHMETADREWLHSLGSSTLQTEDQNLLAYDALDCRGQLRSWLHTGTTPCERDEAQVLAIKYEHLWEVATDIQQFLGLDQLQLPEKRERGYQDEKLLAVEKLFREKYNLGTKENPRYAAYDEARSIWEEAPPLQYLKIAKS